MSAVPAEVQLELARPPFDVSVTIRPGMPIYPGDPDSAYYDPRGDEHGNGVGGRRT